MTQRTKLAQALPRVRDQAVFEYEEDGESFTTAFDEAEKLDTSFS